jgi:predicted  nucleic acid-binding Zn-ribbon protein
MEPVDDLAIKVDAVQSELDRHGPIVNSSREEARNVQAGLQRIQTDLARARAQQAEHERRLHSMPPFDDDRIAAVNSSIQLLSDRLHSINHQISHFQGSNPHLPDLDRLQSQEAALRSACWDAVKRSPSSAIREQLVREAEAVMRAEAAVACTRKQHQVQSEAADLARFHLERTPRVVLDERATDVMLSECTGRRPKHEIAGIVLDMCEQRHITIQGD